MECVPRRAEALQLEGRASRMTAAAGVHMAARRVRPLRRPAPRVFPTRLGWRAMRGASCGSASKQAPLRGCVTDP